jgi:hypothetical protein
MREVPIEKFLARLAAQEHSRIEAALASGQGAALYVNGRGAAVVGITFGTREATVPGNPPKLYGDGELDVFVAPKQPTASMRSPLMDWQQPQQIAAPPRGQPQTLYPEVLFGGRTSSHPRGAAEFQSTARLLPGRGPEPEPVEPQRHLTKEQQWWLDHLRG